MNDSLTQGFVSGWGLPESNLREKETDPDPTFEEKLDPDPTLEKTTRIRILPYFDLQKLFFFCIRIRAKNPDLDLTYSCINKIKANRSELIDKKIIQISHFFQIYLK